MYFRTINLFVFIVLLVIVRHASSVSRRLNNDKPRSPSKIGKTANDLSRNLAEGRDGKRQREIRHQDGDTIDDIKSSPETGVKKRRRKNLNTGITSSIKTQVEVDENGDESVVTADSSSNILLNANSAEEIIQSGYDHLSKGDYVLAAKMFEITNDHYGLSLSYTVLRDYAKAFSHATDAMKENPSIPSLYFQRSRVAGFLGLYDTQIADMYALLALGTDAEMLESHADSFRKTNYFTSALRAYDMVTELTKDPLLISRYSLHKSECYDQLGNSQQAYDSVRTAMELNSHDVDPAISSKLRKFCI